MKNNIINRSVYTVSSKNLDGEDDVFSHEYDYRLD